MYLLTICISSFENCLLSLWPIFNWAILFIYVLNDI
jgi:hypothetical protein